MHDDPLNSSVPAGRNEGSVFHFEMGPIRPPSEGTDRSLLLRVNRNCPWNQCRFCNTYRGRRFEYRSVDEVLRDIDVVKRIVDMLEQASHDLGLGGSVTREVLERTIAQHRGIYAAGESSDEDVSVRWHSLVNVANWLSAGARTVFLQDANAIIMRTPELTRVLENLRRAFPTIVRVTSYGRSKTAGQRSLAELETLRKAGLTRLHVGLESGCDDVLALMKKGVTAEQQVEAGRKIKAAGIALSEYVMPGLGGRKWWRQHALDTASVLNAINPDFIRLRSLIVRRNSALGELEQGEEFHVLDEDGVVDEIALMVENLRAESYLVSDQMSNLLWEVEGKLPEDKPAILNALDNYRRLSRRQRLRLQLQRRADSYSSAYGGLPETLAQQVAVALRALDDRDADPEPLVEAALAQLKQGFV